MESCDHLSRLTELTPGVLLCRCGQMLVWVRCGRGVKRLRAIEDVQAERFDRAPQQQPRRRHWYVGGQPIALPVGRQPG